MQESTVRSKAEEVLELSNEQRELLQSIKPTIKKVLLLGRQLQQILDDLDEYVLQEEEDEDGFLIYESTFSDAFDSVDIHAINDDSIAEVLFDGNLKPTPASAIRRVLHYAKYRE